MICDYEPCVNDDDFTMWEKKWSLRDEKTENKSSNDDRCEMISKRLLHKYTNDVFGIHLEFQTVFVSIAMVWL